MRKIFFLILCSFIGISSFAQSNPDDAVVHIVPEPVSVKTVNGHFQLKRDTKIIAANGQIKDIAAVLARLLDAPTGYHLAVKNGNNVHEKNAIILILNKTPDSQIGEEGYTLQVSPERVVIAANKPQGIFYGMQSLLQLLPPDIESKTAVHNERWDVPCVNILDYPRFGWRGLMLDVSRHFFTVKEVEEYINEMAKYKFNVFHWHLTDDEGWRIQIKGLPGLTDVGAWRVKRTGRWGTFEAPQPGEKATDGGFYTQQEIKDVITYAEKRFITILPEIDVPAHSLALIAAYPNLSSTQMPYPVWPQSPPRTVDNVLDVANDSTWLILDKIFTQVAELFPCPYIHVGGDEANRSFWMKDSADVALMRREGLTTPAQLQSYFEKKLEKIIVSKGKKMIGWDEIVEGGIAPEATVMSWRGMQGGIEAAKAGHNVIMTPWGDAYLDLYQGDPLAEPPTYGKLLLKTSYTWDPVPDSVDPKLILGGQGNLWSESVPNFRHAEYMTWPRAMALSEVFWSPKDKRNWDDFLTREQYRFKYMDVAQVKYAKSQYDPVITGVKGPDDSLEVKITTQMPGLDIYYRFDETNPDNFSPKYDGSPLQIPKGASMIKVISYLNGKPAGDQINCPLSEVAKRMEK
ncbi:MAG: beta-N-acetylhexosaminidase [Chitinophagaceae bacterium]|nr:MAG: beta-N-acetylhexosaminidase [Chitinophagaceae bacterium]